MASQATLKRKTKGDGVEGLKKQTQAGGTKVGFVLGLGEHPNAPGHSISEVAAWQEFGTDDIPERPFLRITIREQRSVYVEITREMMSKILKGKMTADQAAGLLGLKAVADVRNKIDAIRSAENADSTVDIKGFDNPLVHSGIMKKSVTFEKADRNA